MLHSTSTYKRVPATFYPYNYNQNLTSSFNTPAYELIILPTYLQSSDIPKAYFFINDISNISVIKASTKNTDTTVRSQHQQITAKI